MAIMRDCDCVCHDVELGGVRHGSHTPSVCVCSGRGGRAGHLERMGRHLEAARASVEAAEDAGRRLLALLDERQARREAIARMVRQGGEG